MHIQSFEAASSQRQYALQQTQDVLSVDAIVTAPSAGLAPTTTNKLE
jgi:hypothetical protein